MDDFLAQLDAELSAQTAKSAKVKQLETLRQKAENLHVPSSVRGPAKAEWLTLSSELDTYIWQALSTSALFTEQTCDGCGSIHRTFLQFMEHQVHKTKPSTSRWVRVAKPQPSLPRETLIQPLSTHLCSDCCEDHGFAFAPTTRRLHLSESLTTSPLYHQDDLNAQD